MESQSVANWQEFLKAQKRQLLSRAPCLPASSGSRVHTHSCTPAPCRPELGGRAGAARAGPGASVGWPPCGQGLGPGRPVPRAPCPGSAWDQRLRGTHSSGPRPVSLSSPGSTFVSKLTFLPLDIFFFNTLLIISSLSTGRYGKGWNIQVFVMVSKNTCLIKGKILASFIPGPPGRLGGGFFPWILRLLLQTWTVKWLFYSDQLLR